MMSIMRGLQAAAVAVLLCGLGVCWRVRARSTAEPADFKQVKLDNKMVESFIAAQKEIAEFAQKNPASQGDKPDPKVEAELDGIAKKHGFTSFATSTMLVSTSPWY